MPQLGAGGLEQDSSRCFVTLLRILCPWLQLAHIVVEMPSLVDLKAFFGMLFLHAQLFPSHMGGTQSRGIGGDDSASGSTKWSMSRGPLLFWFAFVRLEFGMLSACQSWLQEPHSEATPEVYSTPLGRKRALRLPGREPVVPRADGLAQGFAPDAVPRAAAAKARKTRRADMSRPG